MGVPRPNEDHAPTTLAVDIGGTGSRTLLLGSGRDLSDEFGRAGRVESAFDGLARTIREVRARSGLDRIDHVRAGLTGFNGVVPDLADFGAMLCERDGVTDLIVADDSVTWALGALGGRPGVAVALGTGAVALGIAADGRLAHVDGSGPYLGDRGSGWWVGREALVAAIAAVEARAGGSRQLLTLARRRYGELSALPEALRRDPNPHATIAAFAVDVAAAAQSGDEAAKRIMAEAGAHVGTAAAAAARGSGLPAGFALTLVGGLSAARVLLEDGLTAALAAEGFAPVLVDAAADALHGALLLDSVTIDTSIVRRWHREIPAPRTPARTAEHRPETN